ncbi:MAG: molybdate ABC transporter substrate-binding protein [Luminiphilus sp.]|nr:molybdate ABC transporter substrate-binding protein [Luminiphilus sp.]
MNSVSFDVSGAKLFSVARWAASSGVRWSIVALLSCSGSNTDAAEARIAVAANFQETAKVIATLLESNSPHRYEIIAGSTGKLASQILNGAPFDIFMAADRDRPLQLVDRGAAVAGSQQIYAVGELGLWWPGVSGTPAVGALANLEPRSVCIANPAFAPYGEAAWFSLVRADISAVWREGILRVDNINLVSGLVAQGHVSAGFVARSSLISGMRNGSLSVNESEVLWLAGDAALDQMMVLLTRGKNNPAAQFWVDQIQAPSVRLLIRRDGYRLPGEETDA